jgi:hypothetical protein
MNRHKWAALDGTPTNVNALECMCLKCGIVRMRDGISTVYLKGTRFWTKAPNCKKQTHDTDLPKRDG